MSQNKKKIEQRHMNRRQFLVGSGSTFLVLPPLLSLMAEKVAAQVANNPVRRSVIWYSLMGVNGEYLWPSNPGTLTQQAGLSVYTKPLSQISGNISRLIDGDFVSMYPYMNLMQGLSQTGGCYQGHNMGLLAGVAGDDRDPRIGRTLDSVMEISPNVYKATDSVPNKAIRLFTGEHDQQMTYYIDSSGSRKTSGGIQGDKNLFNTLFKNFTSPTGPAAPADNKLIVDQVYADLKKLETNTRLSSEDKLVLERYISSVYDLQLKINSQSSGPSCTKPTMAFQAVNQGNYYWMPDEGWGIKDCGLMYDNYVELIRLAFACDLTRVVTVGCTLWTNSPINRDSSGGLHHDVVGGATEAADRQKWHLKKFLNLAKALQATPEISGSGNVLDNSLLLWTNELGDWTTGHSTLCMPAITFGKLGGYFKTGNFIDYRQKPIRAVGNNPQYSAGRPYKQLLQSIMAGMGVPKSEYMKYGDGKGYGQFVEGINQFGSVLSTAFTPYAAEHNDPLAWVCG